MFHLATQQFAYVTLLNGGVVYFSNAAQFNSTLPLLAADSQRYPLPVVINVCSKVRLFFELDYNSRVSETELADHLHTLLMHVVYPLFPGARLDMYVSTRPVRYKPHETVGVHVVFPFVVVEPSTLRSILTFACDRFPHIPVDSAPAKRQYASLRPNGFPKIERCSNAVHKNSKHQPHFACAAACDRGILYPTSSIYSLDFIAKLQGSGELLVFPAQNLSFKEELLLTNICPTDSEAPLNQCTLEVAPENARPTQYVPQHTSVEGTQLRGELLAVIRDRFPEFASAQQLSCVHQEAQQGPGVLYLKNIVSQQDPNLAHKCLHAKRYHRQNTIYFRLDLQTGELMFGCYRAACKRKPKDKKYSTHLLGRVLKAIVRRLQVVVSTKHPPKKRHCCR